MKKKEQLFTARYFIFRQYKLYQEFLQLMKTRPSKQPAVSPDLGESYNSFLRIIQSSITNTSIWERTSVAAWNTILWSESFTKQRPHSSFLPQPTKKTPKLERNIWWAFYNPCWITTFRSCIFLQQLHGTLPFSSAVKRVKYYWILLYGKSSTVILFWTFFSTEILLFPDWPTARGIKKKKKEK